MSGKRYFTKNPDGSFTLNTGLRVRVEGGTLLVRADTGEALFSIARQALGHVVTRSDASPRLRGGALRGGEQ